MSEESSPVGFSYRHGRPFDIGNDGGGISPDDQAVHQSRVEQDKLFFSQRQRFLFYFPVRIGD